MTENEVEDVEDGETPVIDNLNSLGLRELGKAAYWSLSTCKQGFGVDQLRDEDLDTYWQSDGQQPHYINIQFMKQCEIQEICIYVDFAQDESYTPNKISIRSGSSFHDLTEQLVVEVVEPKGWIVAKVLDSQDGDLLRANMVQIAVLKNHQNGRDTHLRQVKIFGPVDTNVPLIPNFTTVDCLKYTCLR